MNLLSSSKTAAIATGKGIADGPNMPLDPQKGQRGFSFSSVLEKYGLLIILFALVAVCLVLLPSFRSANVIFTMINAQAVLLLLALIATIVLRVGEFDLSIAGVMVSSAAVVVVLSNAGWPMSLTVVAALVVGLLVGVINAILVVVIGVDSFITTLGMFTALTGVGYAITNNRVIVGVPDALREIARADIFGLPALTWWSWLAVIVLWYVYERTPLGRYMLFIGGNSDAARLAGISVNRIKFGAFTIAGVAAAGVGILVAGNLGAIDPSIGNQYLLGPFAAVFLGATAITVGRFNAIGTLVALYLLAVGITGLQLAGAEPWVSNVFNGVALMVAVALAKLAGRRAKRAS